MIVFTLLQLDAADDKNLGNILDPADTGYEAHLQTTSCT